jgi:hypothetical protein
MHSVLISCVSEYRNKLDLKQNVIVTSKFLSPSQAHLINKYRNINIQ